MNCENYSNCTLPDVQVLSGSSSPDPITYIVGGIILGVAVDVVLVLAEKAYQVVQSYLTHKENT